MFADTSQPRKNESKPKTTTSQPIKPHISFQTKSLARRRTRDRIGSMCYYQYVCSKLLVGTWTRDSETETRGRGCLSALAVRPHRNVGDGRQIDEQVTQHVPVHVHEHVCIHSLFDCMCDLLCCTSSEQRVCCPVMDEQQTNERTNDPRDDDDRKQHTNERNRQAAAISVRSLPLLSRSFLQCTTYAAYSLPS